MSSDSPIASNDLQLGTDGQAIGQSVGFWTSVWLRFRKNRLNLLAFRFLTFLAVVALLADFIAYDKPILCNRGGTLEFPIMGDYLVDLGLYRRAASDLHQDWKTMDYGWAIWPPVRYQSHTIDYANQRLTTPFGKQRLTDWKMRHFLGTTRDGRDVLSGLIHGTRISLLIGIVVVGIASFIGIIVGAFAGFFGDNRLRMTTAGICFGIIGVVLGFFYGFQVRGYALADALKAGAGPLTLQLCLSMLILIGVTVLMVQISRPLNRIPFLGKRRDVWVDIIVSRMIEVMTTIPTLLLVITVMVIVEHKSVYFVMLILGLLGWTNVARFMRAELLRTRSMDFIEAARALGYSELRILLRHAIPNSLTSVVVVMTFGIAGAIAAEATLSFLGIGVPDNVVTWGGLLRDSRQSLSAWWLSIFPGVAIFLTLTSLNLVGEGLRDVLDPKSRHE